MIKELLLTIIFIAIPVYLIDRYLLKPWTIAGKMREDRKNKDAEQGKAE